MKEEIKDGSLTLPEPSAPGFRCECGQPGYPFTIEISIPQSRLGQDFHAKDTYCYKCIRAIRHHLTAGTFRETLTLRPTLEAAQPRGEQREPQHKSPVTTKLPPVQQGGER